MDDSYFSAIIKQEEAASLYSKDVISAEVKFPGQSENTLKVKRLKIVSFDHQKLKNQALHQTLHPELIHSSDKTNNSTTEPFFEVKGNFSTNSLEQYSLYHNRTGEIRLQLSSKPYLKQWYFTARRILQKRYQL